MAAKKEIRVYSVPDQQLLQAFAAIAAECDPPGQGRLGVYIAEGAPPLQAMLSDIQNEPAIKTLLNARASLIHMINLNFPALNASLSLKRSDRFDQVAVQGTDQTSSDQLAKLIASTHQHLRSYDSLTAVEKILGPELAEFYSKREESLQRLERLSQKLIEDNEQYRRRLDKEAEEQSARLNEQFVAKQQEAENQIKDRLAKAEDREKQLEARTKELDDRSSKHARRALRQDLKAIIESRYKSFRLTGDTNRKRWPIHLIFIALLLGAAGLFLKTLWDQAYPPDGVNQLYLFLRIPVAAIAFGLAAVYYIRWNDRWFQRHADEEFRLKRLDLDVDRASWVVEMALEWAQEKGTEIPQELIDRLTRNLFVEEGPESSAVKHPTEDALAALLGASSSLRVNIPGVGEAMLDRRGLRRLKTVTHSDDQSE